MNPASPNLANLRKRAKALVRQHARREHPVADRIRRSSPEDFAGLSDREILDRPFALHQAQRVVAREAGFEDWESLSRSTEVMSNSHRTEPTAAGTPEGLRVHPQVFVTDMERAVAFYRDTLGFEVAYLYGTPPYYGLVTFGSVGVNLRHVDQCPYREGVRADEQLLAATIVVANLKAYFVGLDEAGVEFAQRYQEQPWGAHDFIVEDPDGNLVHFADPASD
ncbi:MAG: VOC family protein [Myxococcota bacterium]|nr:VOC family protein [Myxococcota bacterium]